MEGNDREILRALQDGIPVTREPFAESSKALGINEDEILRRLVEMKRNGTIRRFAVNINQRKIGINANAVVIWKIPEEDVKGAVEKMIECPEISHCYERRTIPGRWEYNLFTVVHDYDKESVDTFVRGLSEEIGVDDYHVLFSTRRFKGISSRLAEEQR